MSFTANNNLQNTGFPEILKDWQHAARMFTDQQFRLAPKTDFLFHVSFNINTAALKNANIYTKYGNELNMLAKAVTLPKFEIKLDDVNQYNRHKQIQYRQNPGDVTVSFYDDNMGLVNQMWQNYYSYYYADTISANTSGSFDRNAIKSSNYINHPYGLDNGSTNPFFNYITISQMARHEYVSVKLINPIIKSWDGMKLDWSKGQSAHEFTMVLSYEAVAYNQGVVEAGAPEGFAMQHYDNTPSTLSGVNPDTSVIDPSFVRALDVESLGGGILNNTINTINTYQNTQDTTAGASGGLSGLTTALAAGSLAIGALGALSNLGGSFGLSDIAFPGAGGEDDETQAEDGDLEGGEDDTNDTSDDTEDADTSDPGEDTGGDEEDF
jgi:hypothetical protein